MGTNPISTPKKKKKKKKKKKTFGTSTSEAEYLRTKNFNIYYRT